VSEGTESWKRLHRPDLKSKKGPFEGFGMADLRRKEFTQGIGTKPSGEDGGKGA